MLNKNATTKVSEGPATREQLCNDFTSLIRARCDEFIQIGFSEDMARFDCLFTMKLILDGLYDEFNVGHALQEWYTELLRNRAKSSECP